ncbi:type I secretion system permease/ATPase [Asticcacaulis sp. ZE23SCel15]|uniref:type I secretion system permease/ATPase n=1 Tax=Asticcacaulis sp. ZE23SCel15 TaxID=3059027 RepID=UPI00265EE42B|nr:type I secretion system permease/ATPase [Asticcacaulis sp. ZE23SCel15]WKL58562.1 type I secretion system permease/ATPase [Asticcacaulis sp. ZE23SCel15]
MRQNHTPNPSDAKPANTRPAATLTGRINAIITRGLGLFKGRSGPEVAPGSFDVRSVLTSARKPFISAAVFSGAINILALTGSLFMLQVYDRVLPSRSLPTLMALVVLVVVLYMFIAALETVRSRLFARIGRYFDLSLRDGVFTLNTHSGLPASQVRGASPFSDLSHIRNFLAGGGPAAIFDLPWMPLYVVLLFILHPALGLCGVAGVLLLTGVTWLSDRSTKAYQQQVIRVNTEASEWADAARRAAETVVPMGMTSALKQQWRVKSDAAGLAILQNSDVLSFYASVSRFIRMILQSLVLALGAYLVIEGDATGGVMIAASILLGRALAPVELAISQWRGFVAARQSYHRLETTMKTPPAEPDTNLPRPTQNITVQDLHVVSPLDPLKLLLNNINFELSAGDALGIIGPSGSGKSTLARAIMGVWPIAKGAIRLDGSTLNQWTSDDLGAFCGYLPQGVDLFSGTVGQNIARFAPDASSEDILRAARMSGIDDFIRHLPQGFDTDIGHDGSRLSAGQRQRLALARALYKDPFLVVLDEPNSALDTDGEAALVRAVAQIRKRGGIAIVFAHRRSVLQSVNKMLVLADGVQKAFGPRDEVLKRLLPPAAANSATPSDATASGTPAARIVPTPAGNGGGQP